MDAGNVNGAVACTLHHGASCEHLADDGLHAMPGSEVSVRWMPRDCNKLNGFSVKPVRFNMLVLVCGTS